MQPGKLLVAFFLERTIELVRGQVPATVHGRDLICRSNPRRLRHIAEARVDCFPNQPADRSSPLVGLGFEPATLLGCDEDLQPLT